MDFHEFIRSRRSIRKFKDEGVTDAQVEELLRDAMSAPSANNEQCWRFIVIRDRELLASIIDAHPFASMLATAPLAIAVVGDTNSQLSPGYWTLDCAAATENLLLGAHAEDLGAVWIGLYPRDERMKAISRILNLPTHILPFSLVAVGHPVEKKSPVDRFNGDWIYQEMFSE